MLERWFLSGAERGNPDSQISAYTRGNDVRVLIDGACYFAKLRGRLDALGAGDRVWFTDWRGDADERLDGPGTEVGATFAALAQRGVEVRGLVWRSHADRMHFSERENRDLTEIVNSAGGEVLLDERVRRAGSHHQKLVALHRRDAADVAFVGGIDLSHGRHDDGAHTGDVQAIEIDHRYGTRPAWHDVHLEVRGPAVRDIERTFFERWNDRTPLDHTNPWRRALARRAAEPRVPTPLSPLPAPPDPAGQHAVQVLRTYAAKRPPYPFARAGERSIARAYLKAFSRARSLVYIEDQYLWSPEAAAALAAALRRAPELRVVAIVPAVPDRNGRWSGSAYRVGQQRAITEVMNAGPGRVAVFDLQAESNLPIYVHAKVCVVDDVWLAVGSDNVNRRSWTNDSEVSCAVIDEARDEREPRDPAGLGDGARVLARDTRLRLWCEHSGVDSARLIDPVSGFDALVHAADALDAWNAGGRRGTRPPGRLRHHRVDPVRGATKLWADAAYRLVVDPDGRPRKLRRAGTF